MQNVVVVNASPLLTDFEVKAFIPMLQLQVGRNFLPAWRGRATQVQLSFMPANGISTIPPDAWPIFLNQHSDEPDDLGWHDDRNGKIFSRVFVGDCLKVGLDWGVTLSHEVLELILDPDIKRVWQMPDGRHAAFEACDAVESDDQAYMIGGHRVSNFVLPSYFSTGAGPWDFRGKLTGPCPTLTSGGYMSVTDASGDWVQVSAARADGLPGRRALLHGHRRQCRSQRPISEAPQWLELIS